MSFFIESSKHIFGKKDSSGEAKVDEDGWPECDQTEMLLSPVIKSSSPPPPLTEQPRQLTEKHENIQEVSPPAIPTQIPAVTRPSVFSFQRIFKFGGASNAIESTSSSTKRIEAEENFTPVNVVSNSNQETTDTAPKRKEPETPMALSKSEPKRPIVNHVEDCGADVESHLQRLVITLRSMEKPSRELADEYRGKIRSLCDMQYE